jgi:hypothetical protein
MAGGHRRALEGDPTDDREALAHIRAVIKNGESLQRIPIGKR